MGGLGLCSPTKLRVFSLWETGCFCIMYQLLSSHVTLLHCCAPLLHSAALRAYLALRGGSSSSSPCMPKSLSRLYSVSLSTRPAFHTSLPGLYSALVSTRPTCHTSLPGPYSAWLSNWPAFHSSLPRLYSGLLSTWRAFHTGGIVGWLLLHHQLAYQVSVRAVQWFSFNLACLSHRWHPGVATPSSSTCCQYIAWAASSWGGSTASYMWPMLPSSFWAP